MRLTLVELLFKNIKQQFHILVRLNISKPKFIAETAINYYKTNLLKPRISFRRLSKHRYLLFTCVSVFNRY